MEPRVIDNPNELRYELWLGERLGGEIRYVREDDKVVLVHTEVDPSLEGQGLGNVLVQGALDDPIYASAGSNTAWSARS